MDVSKLPPPAQVTVDFDRDIAPILENSCLRCHGTERPKSRFSLATRETALKGGGNGVDIIPQDSANSPLIHYVARLVEDMEMPPPGRDEPLTAEQVGLLRAWIDQGVQWPEKSAEPPITLTITPMVRWIGVSGNERQFREHYWTENEWAGGGQGFSYEQRLGPGEKLTLEGSAFLEAREYSLNVNYEKRDVGFIRGGFSQYRRYYDDSGGFYAPFGTAPSRLNRDLAVDIGRAWIEFGLTLPDWPRLVLGYEYLFKEGAKSSLTWSDVGMDVFGANPVFRSVYPAYKGIDENTHILKFDLTHEIAGVTLEDNLRAEFHDLSTERVTRDFVAIGSPLPDSAQRVREEYSHVQVVNALHAEKELREWFFVSGGYLYSKLNADAALAWDFFTPSNPSALLFSLDAANPITLERQSHLLNFNGRLGPWEGLTFFGGVQSEWSHEEGLGWGVSELDPRVFSSQKDTMRLDEDFGLRYTRIPHTVVYADARLQQEWADHYEKDDLNPGGTDFIRDTDARSELYEYRAGFSVSPWTKAMFEWNYKYRLKRTDYDHLTDSPGPSSENGYPGFIRLRDVELNEIEVKLSLRPASWLKTTLKYQLVGTDYRTTTDPSVITLFDPITFQPTLSPQPGGENLAGNYDAHIYSLHATLTPWKRLYFTSTLSYADSRTISRVNGRAGVAAYAGGTLSVLSTAHYVVNDKTDWNASYSYSHADYRQHNETDGLPLGVAYQHHGFITGISRRIKENFTARLQYGFFRYDEPTSGGANNYTAHAVFGMASIALP